MQLTQWSDYSLRVLMYCALMQNRDTPVTIDEIIQKHDIAKSTLTKIVWSLSNTGLLKTTRGRNGGITLGKPAGDIRIGDVVRFTETDFHTVECFDKNSNSCQIINACKLKTVIKKATNQFLHELDQVNLLDVVTPAHADAYPIHFLKNKKNHQSSVAK